MCMFSKRNVYANTAKYLNQPSMSFMCALAFLRNKKKNKNVVWFALISALHRRNGKKILHILIIFENY